MTNEFDKCSDIEKKYIAANARLIEGTLDAFGLTTRIVDLQIAKEYYEYDLEITMGTPVEEIEKHAKDLALAVASPTGKVKIIAPIPGRSLIGIQIPRPNKSLLPKLVVQEDTHKPPTSNLREILVNILLSGSKLLEYFAHRLSSR